MDPLDHLDRVLPVDREGAVLVGRLLDPALGPCVVAVRGDEVVDLTPHVPTASDLLDAADRLELARDARAVRRWSLPDVLVATLGRDRSQPHLLAPFDLQVLKAAGVTFARSMLERVIEEHAEGDPARAERCGRTSRRWSAGRSRRSGPGRPRPSR